MDLQFSLPPLECKGEGTTTAPETLTRERVNEIGVAVDKEISDPEMRKSIFLLIREWRSYSRSQNSA